MAEVGFKDRIFPALTMAVLVGLAITMPLSIAFMNAFLGLGLLLALVDRFSGPVLGWRRTPLDEPLGLLVGITLLSALLGLDPSKSIVRFAGVWVFLIYYIFLWYGSSRERIRILLDVLCGVAAAVSVYAVVQHYTGLALVGRPLSTTSTFAGETVRYLSRGTFSHHQTFANVYFLVFCLAFSLALTPAPAVRRILRIAAAALVGLSLAFSYTRGIWVATLVSVPLMALFRGRRAFVGAVVAMILCWSVVVAVPSTFSSRARSIFTIRANIDRVIIWQASWAMLRDHPLLGIGAGNYPGLQEEYLPPGMDMRVSRAHAHNSFLQLAIERGIFGLVAYGWIWYVILRLAFSSLWFLRGSEGFRLAALRGAAIGVVGFLIDGFFENNFGDTEVVALLLFLVAVIVALRVKQAEREPAVAAGGTYAAA